MMRDAQIQCHGHRAEYDHKEGALLGGRSRVPIRLEKETRMFRSIFAIALAVIMIGSSLSNADAKGTSHHHGRKHHHHKHHRILFIRT